MFLIHNLLIILYESIVVDASPVINLTNDNLSDGSVKIKVTAGHKIMFPIKIKRSKHITTE